MHLLLSLLLLLTLPTAAFNTFRSFSQQSGRAAFQGKQLMGWKQDESGSYAWVDNDDDDESFPSSISTTTAPSGKPNPLPPGRLRPKQSLGQNYLQDGNTIDKIVEAFDKDLRWGFSGWVDDNDKSVSQKKHLIELGPGLGSLTTPLVRKYGTSRFSCIEIDSRAVELLREKHPVEEGLRIIENDVLKVDYAKYLEENDDVECLSIVGNLPYYITSQILFAICDANHVDASGGDGDGDVDAPATIDTSTVTMQYEVALRLVAPVGSGKDRGILSVVFELYADSSGGQQSPRIHFKIPPTVFYPVPKVTSALVGIKFCNQRELLGRLAGVKASNFRTVVTTAFGQRRKTVRNSLKELIRSLCDGDEEKMKNILDCTSASEDVEIVANRKIEGNEFALGQALPADWAKRRPEEFTAAEFVELTRLIFGGLSTDTSDTLAKKVWRKKKHGD